MVRHRHTISFLFTTLLYIILFGSYFYLITNTIIKDQQAQNSTIQLSLAEFTPEVVPVTEETEEEEVVEEVSNPDPEPIIKEEPVVEKVVPEPVTPKVLPKPVVKEQKFKKKKVEKKKKHKKKKRKKKKRKTRSAVSTSRGVKKQGSGHASTAQKNRFLVRVRQRINRNKSYPKAAKKRGMQGSVKVKFTILRNGKVAHISVSGPTVFHASARRAIEKSFPIRTKNIPVSLPKTVSLTLRYQLR